MGYGRDLLERAAANAGSRYALSKMTGIPESALSYAWNGKRQVPASWVLKLARVAEVDPTEAMEFWDLEQAEKKRRRQQSLRSALGGAAATFAISASSVVGLDRPDHATTDPAPIDASTHRINRLVRAVLRRTLLALQIQTYPRFAAPV